MNNKRIGRLAVTAIVGMLSAISGVVGVEMVKSLRKETERAGKNIRCNKDDRNKTT